MEKNVEEAVKIALQYGAIDGDHHKAWVIDQILRKLLGLKEYKKTINDWEEEDDEWQVGIPP